MGWMTFFYPLTSPFGTIKGAIFSVEISGFGNRWRFPKSMGGPQIIH